MNPTTTTQAPPSAPRTPPEPRSERAFRERLRRREPRALERFFRSESDSIRARVQRLVGDLQEAEDLTQDILLRIHRGLPRFDPSKRLGPWVETILRNRVRDHWRSRRAARDMQGLEAADPALTYTDKRPGGASVGGAAAEEPRTESIRRAIEHLPPGLRSVLLLRIFDEMSFETIAATLDLTPSAARKRYSRALNSLRSGLPAADPHSN